MGWGEVIVGAFLLTAWLMRMKYPKDITQRDANRVILVIIIIIIDKKFVTISKKFKLDYEPQKFHVASEQNFEIVE